LKRKIKLQAENFINLRTAQTGDEPQIAPLMIEAGGGFYEFLFGGLGPEMTLLQFFKRAISADEGPYSWKNCLVAERCGHLIGFANAFPTRLIRDQDPGPIAQESLAHLAPVTEIMDWDSFFLNSIAVLPSARGQGVGQALLEEVLNRARRTNFQNVTLQVWEGNDSACRLYERHGFTIVRTAVLEPHPKLAETRSLLMRCEFVEG
jgi:ribosomal protein S18 acetylase RimI-like enzyme